MFILLQVLYLQDEIILVIPKMLQNILLNSSLCSAAVMLN